MLRRHRERRREGFLGSQHWRRARPEDDGVRPALVEDFSLDETHLSLLRAFQKEVLFGTVWTEGEVVLQYYKCYCVCFFFFFSNLEVYLLTNAAYELLAYWMRVIMTCCFDFYFWRRIAFFSALFRSERTLWCVYWDVFSVIFKPNCLPVVAIYTVAFWQQVLLSQTESHSETLQYHRWEKVVIFPQTITALVIPLNESLFNCTSAS